MARVNLPWAEKSTEQILGLFAVCLSLYQFGRDYNPL